MEVAELRRQLDSVRMSGRGGATPNPQVRREEVVCNDIELLSSLSPAASACHTYPSTANHLTSQLQTRGIYVLSHALRGCVCVCECVCVCVYVHACVRAHACMCVCEYLCVSMYVCAYVCPCMHACMRVQGFIQVFLLCGVALSFSM